jgi:dienelactone hydrolase
VRLSNYLFFYLSIRLPAGLFCFPSESDLNGLQGDPAEYYEDGEWFKILKQNHPTSETVSYLGENHGFLPRGDLANPATKEAVNDALAKIFAFFHAHMA